MNLAEILEEIPKLSFAERQELVRKGIAVDEDDAKLTPEEHALLDQRMQDFRRNPEAGLPIDKLKGHIQQRLDRRS